MIEGQILLQLIKNVPGFEHAIIAGGYVRDHIMGGNFKDIDIFIPINSRKEFRDKNELLEKGLVENLTKDPAIKEKYKGYHTFYTADYLYHNIPVQIVGHRIDAENFAQILMKSFNFEIDKMYYDGIDTVITDGAKKDLDSHKATLSELPQLSYIPIAMKKFERLKAKYPKINFGCSCLEIKTKKENLIEYKRVNTLIADDEWF